MLIPKIESYEQHNNILTLPQCFDEIPKLEPVPSISQRPSLKSRHTVIFKLFSYILD